MTSAVALMTQLLLVTYHKPCFSCRTTEGLGNGHAQGEEAHPMADGKAEDPTAPCRRFAQRVCNESRLQALIISQRASANMTMHSKHGQPHTCLQCLRPRPDINWVPER